MNGMNEMEIIEWMNDDITWKYAKCQWNEMKWSKQKSEWTLWKSEIVYCIPNNDTCFIIVNVDYEKWKCDQNEMILTWLFNKSPDFAELIMILKFDSYLIMTKYEWNQNTQYLSLHFWLRSSLCMILILSHCVYPHILTHSPPCFRLGVGDWRHYFWGTTSSKTSYVLMLHSIDWVPIFC